MNRPAQDTMRIGTIFMTALVGASLMRCGRTTLTLVGDDDARDGRPCLSWGPFSSPTRVDDASRLGGDDWVAYVSTDETVLFLQVQTAGQKDALVSVRSDSSRPFSTPEPVTFLNSVQDDSVSWMSEDGETILFSSDRPGGEGGQDLWLASGVADLASATSITPIAGVNSTENESQGWMSRDGLRLYMVRRIGGGPRQLWMAERSVREAAFGAPAPISELSSTANHRTFALSSDELELFISSDQSGGVGDYDLWRALRTSRDLPFGTAEVVAELSSSLDDAHPRLARGGSVIYFNYETRYSGELDADVWRAERSCLQWNER